MKTLVGANIRTARGAMGWSQRQLAQQLDTDSFSVSRWERGLVTPGTESLMGLARALGRDVAWFYTEHEDAAA